MESSPNVSPVTTYGGWAAVIGITGFLLYRSYAPKSNRRGSVTKVPGRQPELAGDSKKADKATKPKPKAKTPSGTSKDTAPSAANYNWEEDDVADKKADREFARQMANAHTGTKFASKKSDDKRQRSIKQSRAEEVPDIPAAEKTSVPSSNAGDADDDLSPQVSPVVGAVSGQDVSDMLERTTSGPSVLRLTDTDSVKPKPQRKAAAPEPVETKKQRQNRKKAEAAKALREEEEKDRKVKMEQQRRTARVAEGRAAKDGSAFVANQKNAWTEKSATGTQASATIQPLDTFEQPAKAEPSKTPTPTPAASKKESSDPWMSGIPSEEEQLEMIRQEESWSEVKTKKKGRKNASTEPSAAPNATAGSTSSAKPAAATNSQAPVNGATKKPILTSSSSSFAALTPDETDDNDDDDDAAAAEKEWDV